MRLARGVARGPQWRLMTVRAGVNAALAAGATAAGASLALLATGRVTGLGIAVAVTGVVYLAVGLVGAAILRSQPRNAAGWVFLVSGTAAPINCLASTVALILFQDGELGAAA